MQTSPSTQKTVIVGMSGGVDSSVSALLLKQQGYRVIGMFMKNWDEPESSQGPCTAQADYEDVAHTCAMLDIPYLAVDFTKEYQTHVFSHFLREYEAGYTPNPDILCNREIKFKVFFDKAMELGADYLATGHYCRTDGVRLLKGADPAKDQSYFLNAIDGKVLSKVLFPIGHLHKTEVRRIAAEHNLPTQAKKDSTGICFIGERKFQTFLQNYIPSKPGTFCLMDGTPVGTHRGVAYYTLGQRRHLGLGGDGDRWFVIKKDVPQNIVYVARGHDHPELYAQDLTATELSWIRRPAEFKNLPCKAKIRYRQEDQECIVQVENHDRIKVTFLKAQWAITPRQSIAFYDGEECLGGAMIQC